ncbi:MAG: ATP-binding protein [Ardenticatenia bacterium]|nr:ATP-binding protein [Ardenticatenia bacterium]
MIREVELELSRLIYRKDRRGVNGRSVRLLLADHILNSLGQRLDESAVWEFLTSEGYYHRDWSMDHNAATTVQAINARYVSHTEAELINGQHIARSETDQVLAALRDEASPTLILITGAAGSGKSCTLVQVVRRLQTEGEPVLALRLDSCPDDAISPNDLGRKLDLPDSPVAVLAGIADGRRCALIVDQLDAVSITSGRNTPLWDVFEAAVNEASAYPNMHVVSACREFDAQFDPRLLRLCKQTGTTSQVILQKLDVDTVKVALEAASVAWQTLTPNQIALLQTPLHLNLFLQGDPITGNTFSTIEDLYSQYSRHKSYRVSQRLKQSVVLTEVTELLCVSLSDSQSLSAPEDVLDTVMSVALAMASEHVLVLDNHRWRFFHEGYFDYVFARRFARTHGSLRDLLTGPGERQLLFRRSQVRQILAYQRSRDLSAYLLDLEWLLTADTVRFHIKKLVLYWLRSVRDPNVSEWQILDRLAVAPRLDRHVIATIADVVSWFDLLDGEKVWSRWLEADEPRVTWTVWLMTRPEIMRNRSSRVAQLLADHSDSTEPWKQRLRAIMTKCEVYHSRDMMDLFLRLIDDGSLDGARPEFAVNDDWWSVLHSMARDQPDMAAEAIAHWIDRQLQLWQSDEERGRRPEGFDYSAVGPSVIVDTAKDSRAYAVNLLPRILAAAKATTEARENGVDLCWLWPSLPLDDHSVGDALLWHCGRAMARLSRDDPDFMDEMLQIIRDDTHEIAAYLLMQAWCGNPGRYADRAVEYLVSNPQHLEMGYFLCDGDGNSALGAEVLAVFGPHCSPDVFQSLEGLVLRLIVPGDPMQIRSAERTQLRLLTALEPNGLSRTARMRLGELQRKYPDYSPREPRPLKMHVVESPVPSEAMPLMRDEHWLAAMRKYTAENSHGVHDPFKGGRDELARALEGEVKTSPVRFAALADQMESSLPPEFFQAILRGVTNARKAQIRGHADEPRQPDVLASSLISVVQRAHSLPNRPCGMNICYAVMTLYRLELPIALFDIVSYYAINDPDPTEELWQAPDVGSGRYYAGDPFTNGINSARGAAAQVTAELLAASGDRWELLEAAVKSLVSDRSLAVRSCAIATLLALMNTEPDLAVTLFLEMVGDSIDLFKVGELERFLHYTAPVYYHRLRPLLMKMLQSQDSKAVMTASRQISVAALTYDSVREDAVRLREGTIDMRTAAAGVYAVNLGDPIVGDECADLLIPFFHDEAIDVRKEAARCFRQKTIDWGSRIQTVIASLIQSPAFVEARTDLLRAMEDLPEVTGPGVMEVLQRAVETIGPEGSSIAYHASMDARYLATLVVRLYDQSGDPVVKAACLDIIDRMEMEGMYGISDELVKFDR